MRTKISFIGVGNMASAIISAITSRTVEPISWNNIVLYDLEAEKVDKYISTGAYIASSVVDAVNNSECVILCVKPQSFPSVLPFLSECRDVEKKLFITIAAGVEIQTVEISTHGAAVVRVMPNTPLMIGKGVSALCRNRAVSDDDFNFVRDLFASAGQTFEIDESEMNKIISVTSSSPAYVLLLIKAMYEGAICQGLLKTDCNSGLDEKELLDCICNTVIGTAELMKCGGKSPDEQICTVTSKGGTTEKAIDELNRYSFTDGIVSAMKKCTQRADELSGRGK